MRTWPIQLLQIYSPNPVQNLSSRLRQPSMCLSPMSLCSTGWQAPVSGLCGYDGGDVGFPGQTEADSTLFCNLSSQRAEVYGTLFLHIWFKYLFPFFFIFLLADKQIVLDKSITWYNNLCLHPLCRMHTCRNPMRSTWWRSLHWRVWLNITLT